MIRPNRRLASGLPAIAILFAAMLIVGCGGKSSTELPTEYGRRQSPRGAGSVNGTGVLADMFEERGHNVKTWHRLSPRIRSSQVIVWAPDSMHPPSDEAVRFLEAWLAEDDGRTLVYIGRDYDAAIKYWESVLPDAPPEQTSAIESRLKSSRRLLNSMRKSVSGVSERWFTMDKSESPRPIRRMAGQWAVELQREDASFDPAKADIDIQTQLRPPGSAPNPSVLEYTPVLVSGNNVLVSRVTFGDDYQPLPAPPEADDAGDSSNEDDDEFGYGYGYGYRPSDSQIIVVSNGSFLLNLPLVNHQHRLLAGKLIDECEFQSGMSIAFLESGRAGVPVHEQEPKPHSYIELLRTWPVNVILLHALGLGLLFCFVFFPIFGRPIERTLKRMEKGVPIYVSIGSQTTGDSDFGKHIEALGEMMQRTGEVQYAQARIRHYQQNVKRDSGVSHRSTLN